ncbi:MAG: hypothetical protein GXY51_09675 [Bacteroidetes bacterium]|nr:hypothetical protein [Bacteroidota bacterium]
MSVAAIKSIHSAINPRASTIKTFILVYRFTASISMLCATDTPLKHVLITSDMYLREFTLWLKQNADTQTHKHKNQ